MGTFISTKGRYAIRLLIDLAEHADGERIPLKDVAERQCISLKYLETFMPSLVKAGLVSVDVFGVTGKKVATLYRGNLSAGSYAFSLADMPKGRYIVRVKGAGLTATQPVLIK